MASKKLVKKKAKAPARKPVKKVVAKKTIKKAAKKYVCSVCGLTVTVNKACGCIAAHGLICCRKPMKAKPA